VAKRFVHHDESYFDVEGTRTVVAPPHFPQELLRPGSTDASRTGFSYMVLTGAGVTYAAGVKSCLTSLLDTMNPSKDRVAEANSEIDLSNIPLGASITAQWRGKPIFIRHRDDSQIDEASKVDMAALKDPETDSARVKKPEWLVVIGICTHLGCVPVSGAGDYNGWFCPCHGSHYDSSGRIRKGPAPKNLEIPPYKFLDDTKILVGEN